MKKVIATVLTIGIVLFILNKGFQVYNLSRSVNDVLEKKEWTAFVKEKEMKYDVKRGTFYMTIIFKEEENITYEFDLDYDKMLYTIAMNEKNEEVQNKELTKYSLP